MENRFKFRAWDFKNKVMIYNIGIVNNIAHAVKAANCDFSTMDGEFIMYEGTNCGKVPFMQCVGLKDRNGKLIYEGDVVKGICSNNPDNVCQGLKLYNKMGKEITGIIRYSESFGQFYFTTDDITFLHLYHGLSEKEVIGNIYNNPDLLEK